MISFNRNFKLNFNVFLLHIKFSCSDNITPRNSKTEPHLSRCSEEFSTGVTSIFMWGGRKFDIMDFLCYHEL